MEKEKGFAYRNDKPTPQWTSVKCTRLAKLKWYNDARKKKNGRLSQNNPLSSALLRNFLKYNGRLQREGEQTIFYSQTVGDNSRVGPLKQRTRNSWCEFFFFFIVRLLDRSELRVTWRVFFF